MKRDIELVLKILEHLEKRDEISVIQNVEIPEQDLRVVAYHCRPAYV
jgi:hypothetical protein